MAPCRNLGASGPETEMRRLDERQTRPLGGGGDDGGGGRGGWVDADEKDL